MKRFCVFMLAVLILFTCSACKKENPPVPVSDSMQTVADRFRRFRPCSSSAVPAGPHGVGRADSGKRAAAVFRRSRSDRQYVHKQR